MLFLVAGLIFSLGKSDFPKTFPGLVRYEGSQRTTPNNRRNNAGLIESRGICRTATNQIGDENELDYF